MGHIWFGCFWNFPHMPNIWGTYGEPMGIARAPHMFPIGFDCSSACGRGDVWVRACNVWLPQGHSYSMNVVVHIGKQRLCKPRDCHQILTSSRTMRQRQNDDLQFCLPCEKCEWWGRRERAPVKTFWKNRSPTKRHAETDTVENTRDGGSTSEWPFLETNLFVVTNSTISFQIFFDCSWSTSSSFSRSLKQRWLLRSGLGPAAHVLIDEHASRARPSSAVAVFEIE